MQVCLVENFVKIKIGLKASHWRLATQILLIALMLLAGMSLAACGREKQTNNANSLQVTVIPAPEGKNGQYLTIQLADASGQPVTDSVVSVEGNMQHAGMAPVMANGVRDEADGIKDGKYQVPFGFTMLGDWVLTVSVEKADGTKVQQDINVTASEQGITVKVAGK
jgi:hypothetical protein